MTELEGKAARVFIPHYRIQIDRHTSSTVTYAGTTCNSLLAIAAKRSCSSVDYDASADYDVCADHDACVDAIYGYVLTRHGLSAGMGWGGFFRKVDKHCGKKHIG